MRKRRLAGKIVCHNNILLSRVQSRIRFAKEQATKFLVSLNVLLAMAVVALLASKVTFAVGAGSGQFNGNETVALLSWQSAPGPDVKVLAKGKAGQIHKTVPQVAMLRDRTKMAIGVSRGSLPLPPPPPAPAESAHTIAWINSLNKFLAGSPMAGMGEVFYNAAKKNGVDPRLSPSIARIESGLGRATPGGFNAFGMTAGTAPGHGRNGKWQAFASWQDAIESNIAFIKAHWGSSAGPYNMRGYATSRVWSGHVSSAMSSIANPGPEPPAAPVLGPTR